MHNYTLDFLNTLDEYKTNTKNMVLKDPYLKNQLNNSPLLKDNQYCWYMGILLIGLFISNIILTIQKDIIYILLFSFKQWGVLILLNTTVLTFYEYWRKKLVYTEIREKGNPYLEEIKEYYFYNKEINSYILEDLAKFLNEQQYDDLISEIKNKDLKYKEIFYIYDLVENKSKRNKIKKILNLNSQLEKEKRNRQKELNNKKNIQLGVKELKEHFNSGK